MSNSEELSFLKNLRPGSRLTGLSDPLSYHVLVLNAYAERKGRWPGAVYHSLMGELLESKPRDARELSEWIEAKFPAGPSRRERFEKDLDRARLQAQGWLEKGICVAELSEGVPDAFASPACPRIVFGIGETDRRLPRVALFNSRKPRLVSPDAEWLKALRLLLPRIGSQGVEFLSSLGTLTYDLVGAYAIESGAPLLLILPFEIERVDSYPFASRIGNQSEQSISAYTCLTNALSCSKATRMVCRDRLLAAIADGHLVLEVRSGGNLLAVLCEQQRNSPRRQWIYVSDTKVRENEGNFELLEGYSEHAVAVCNTWKIRPGSLSENGHVTSFPHNTTPSFPHNTTPSFPRVFGGNPVFARPGFPPETRGNDAGRTEDEGCKQALRHAPSPPLEKGATDLGIPEEFLKAEDIAWRDYLYHFTRSCPGVWPGQSYTDYLLSLLGNDLLAGHTALDTLCRILMEGRIRASARVIRGEEPVVSWSARPPLELQAMRRWNPALIRWTFEPYGIAVCRKFLRELGAKPTIYAPAEAYSRLKPSERHRFQLHDRPRSVWKHEREWRLPRDLFMDSVPADQAFVFVPSASEAEVLRPFMQNTRSKPRVVTLH